MRYFEKCETCKHDHGNAWTGVCKNCCFCDKYEEKPKEDNFETRLNRIKNTLDTWARIYGISLAVDIRDEQGRLIGPWKRNFIFVDKKTGNKVDFAVDFNFYKPEEDVRIIDTIKDTVRRKMITKEKGYAFNDPETYGRGGFTYLTTRNPYTDIYNSVYRKNLLLGEKHDGFTAKNFTVDEMHAFKPFKPKHDDRVDAMRLKSEWVPDSKFYHSPEWLEFRKRLLNSLYGSNKEVNMNTVYKRLAIKDVIFNGPATIVIWNDNTKTVVKAQDGEKIDYEKGLAMAISKKALGNQGNYYDHFSKWLKNAPVVKKTRKTVKKDK